MAATPQPLACRIAVASGDAPVDGNPADGNKGHGGFISFPGAQFSADASSLGAYDKGPGKWVPVFRSDISPDGSRYAFGTTPQAAGPVAGSVHFVEIASGTDHLVGVPGPVNVVDYETEGAYAVSIVPRSDAPPAGLVLVDPSAGSFRQITADQRAWMWVGGGFAYAVDLDSANDPNPPQPTGPGSVGNRLVRLNLATGAIDTVHVFMGQSIQILGLDAARAPVVSASNATVQTIQVLGTGGYAGIWNGVPGAPGNPGAPIVADSHGIWFGSQSGAIWLARTPGGTAQQIATAPFQNPQPASGCD